MCFLTNQGPGVILSLVSGNTTEMPFRPFEYITMIDDYSDLEQVGAESLVDCLTHNYLNDSQIAIYNNEELTCYFISFVDFSKINITSDSNSKTMYVNSDPNMVESYGNVILKTLYQDFTTWEEINDVDDVNICASICTLKGPNNCMMFELVGTLCRISKKMRIPMKPNSTQDLESTPRILYLNEGTY